MAELLSYRPSNSAIFYKPPRSWDVGRTAAGLAIAALLAVGGGFAYSRVLPSIDSVVPRVAAVLVAALAVGLLGLIPVHVGRVRAPAMAAALGGVVAVVALYVMWVVWTHGVLRQLGVVAPVWRLAVHPVPLSHIVRRIGEVGTWKYQGTVYRGPVLYALWMVEAGLVLAAGTLLPPKGLYSDRPICAGCRTRCARVPNLPRFDARRQAEVLAAIDGRDLDALSTCPAAPHDDAPELSLTLMSCPRCHQLNVLTVNRIAWERGRNGRLFVRTVPLINQQLITPDEAERLTATCARIRAERSRPHPTSADDPGPAEAPAVPPTDDL